MLCLEPEFGIRLRIAVKLNFRPYIQRYTSPNENFEYSYPLIILHVFTIDLKSSSKVKVKDKFEKTLPQAMHMNMTSTILSIKVNA